MPSRRDIIGLRKLVLTIWLSALLQVTQPVRAEVRVTGQADAVTVETREASVDEVLAALRASFNLQYRTSGPLNRVITGTYTGSLQQVITRLLEGLNYVLQSSAGGRELIVVGPGAARASVSASGRPFVAVAEQPIAPPVPNANSATLAVPGASPLSLSAPVPPSTNSVVAPANGVAVTAPLPPLPEKVPKYRPPGAP